ARSGANRVAQPLGGPRQRRAGRESEGLLDLGCRLLGQPEHRQGESRVKARELLQLRIPRAAAPERLERAAVILLPVADEADVVAESVDRWIGAKDGLEERLGRVVALLREL